MTRSTGPVAGLLAGATALAVLLPPAAATAQAPAPTDTAGAWLAGQLVDGDHLASEVGGQSYVNYGPTADVALGLLATGAEPATFEAVLDFLTDPDAGRRLHRVGRPRPTPARRKARPHDHHGRPDPHAVGGTDLVSALEGLEADTGRYRGPVGLRRLLERARPVLRPALPPRRRTAWTPPAPRCEFLADAQCDDGGFPQDARHGDLRVERRRHGPRAAGAGRRRRGSRGAGRCGRVVDEPTRRRRRLGRPAERQQHRLRRGWDRRSGPFGLHALEPSSPALRTRAADSRSLPAAEVTRSPQLRRCCCSTDRRPHPWPVGSPARTAG